jgi:4'-phosphopantetheinyl transferase
MSASRAAAAGLAAQLRPLPWCPLDPLPAAFGPPRPPGPEPSNPVAEPLPAAVAGASSRDLQLLLLDRRDRRLGGLAPAFLEALLTPAERRQRDRFRQSADRDRFLLARAGLRRALGAWLGLDPAALVFALGAHGKPGLAAPGPASPSFNVSHSGDMILLGFHPRWPVGVDVERLRSDLAWEPLARRLLPAPQQAALAALPPELQAEAFLSAWCRLEARLKARGVGLAGLERRRGEEGDPAGQPSPVWEVAVPSGYRAAVALALLA